MTIKSGSHYVGNDKCHLQIERHWYLERLLLAFDIPYSWVSNRHIEIEFSTPSERDALMALYKDSLADGIAGRVRC